MRYHGGGGGGVSRRLAMSIRILASRSSVVGIESLLEVRSGTGEVPSNGSIADPQKCGYRLRRQIVPVGQDDDGSLTEAQLRDCHPHFGAQLRLVEGHGLGRPFLSRATGGLGPTSFAGLVVHPS